MLISRFQAAGQPVGLPVGGGDAAVPTRGLRFDGRYGRLEPLDVTRHTDDLWKAFQGQEALFTYMSNTAGFGTRDDIERWCEAAMSAPERVTFAILAPPGHAAPGAEASGREAAVGYLAFHAIESVDRAIEVGSVAFSPRLQRTRLATEAVTLLVTWAFDAGYRRVTWKCDTLNRASIAAAERLGFTFEGLHRNAKVVRGRNRDSAWFSLVVEDWPGVRDAYDRWLDPGNFDAAGRQRSRLSDLTRPHVHEWWPRLEVTLTEG